MNHYSLFLLLLISINCFAWIEPDKLMNLSQSIEDKYLFTENFNSVKDFDFITNELTTNILNDYEKKVKDEFAITPYFKDSVRFWFYIYTQFSSSSSIIHDKTNLKIIYKVLNFDDLNKSNLNRFVKSNLQSKLSLEHSIKVKKILQSLGSKTRNFNGGELRLINNLKKVGVIIPKKLYNRKLFFRNLSKNIRVQTGQKNMIYQGILNSTPYTAHIFKLFDVYKLPHELLAIPFLESSFNISARSKVGAAGVWQIMPFIGRLLMPKVSKGIDYRYNPYISTIAASYLLRENKMILKRWDLAITAYNSGTKHLVRAKRQFKNVKDISLEYILKNYKHPHIGFASKNFYSEFLALVHVLAYKNQLFPIEGLKFQKDKFKNLYTYLLKCKLSNKWLTDKMKNISPNYDELNQHIYRRNYIYKGTVILSDKQLTKNRYWPISLNDIQATRPRYWLNKYLKNQSCSTK